MHTRHTHTKNDIRNTMSDNSDGDDITAAVIMLSMMGMWSQDHNFWSWSLGIRLKGLGLTLVVLAVCR